MKAKLLTGTSCLLLLAIAIAPSVLGHSQRAPLAIDFGSGYTGAASAGVSGRYIGSVGPAIAEAYANPAVTFALYAGMMCDAEVLIDYPSQPNEVQIDGAGPLHTGGGVQNFWDDGGYGGACHTGHYTTPMFNTLGCQAGTQVSGGTHLGTDIWVGASCDWKEDQRGAWSEQILMLCLVNSIRAFNHLEILGPPTPDLAGFFAEVTDLADCTLAFVDCQLDWYGCIVDGTEICGFDGLADAIDYGYAGIGASIQPAIFPAATGIYHMPYPWLPPDPRAAPCQNMDEVASIFVFDTVAWNAGSIEIVPALTGEVFSIPAVPSTPSLPPSCSEATAANPVVVQLVCTYYYDYYDSSRYIVCASWVSAWDPLWLSRRNSCPPYLPAS